MFDEASSNFTMATRLAAELRVDSEQNSRSFVNIGDDHKDTRVMSTI